MSTFTRILQVFVALFAVAFALFYKTVQDNMAATKAPTKQWADGPLPLVKTPMFETGKNDTFTKGASHMALLHDAIFRGYNSIYLQAPYIKAEDHDDFIGYALAWFKFVKGHHDDEEANLFPKVEELVGKKGIWDETIHEHATFLPGLTQYAEYLTVVSSSPSTFSGTHLRKIMDTFATPFAHHFHSEIRTIASLSALLDESSIPDSIGPTFAAWGKQSIMKAGLTDVVPFLFLNFDRSDAFENGLWKAWPPMPAPIRWGLTNIGGSWHWGWWRFASCDAAGMPRELAAVPEGVVVPEIKVEL